MLERLSTELLGGKIAEVSAGSLERLWALQAENPGEGVSFSTGVVSHLCDSPAEDAMAVFGRTTLIRLLMQTGSLERWREGNSFRRCVFETAARFPIALGLNGVNPEEFVAMLAD